MSGDDAIGRLRVLPYQGGRLRCGAFVRGARSALAVSRLKFEIWFKELNFETTFIAPGRPTQDSKNVAEVRYRTVQYRSDRGNDL